MSSSEGDIGVWASPTPGPLSILIMSLLAFCANDYLLHLQVFAQTDLLGRHV